MGKNDMDFQILLDLERGLPEALASQTTDPLVSSPPKVIPTTSKKTSKRNNVTIAESGPSKRTRSASKKDVCTEPLLYCRRVKGLSSLKERDIVGRMSIEALVGKAYHCFARLGSFLPEISDKALLSRSYVNQQAEIEHI
ncbi:hypothetical protein L1987_03619 [Smallanthus sonchifolius]|uniref:Uncharacterized protein n=1 Tax=Smallanthus sonchifolius TaxID=185202 RepID=A0ACB9KBA5_9ASTR|nr:hypothetical protein L1987_03619 [Smallanthus sonchifolius]